ncbi:MAG: terminase TerL endonuclease subunit, partial [Bryobacteraceae bacterium]
QRKLEELRESYDICEIAFDRWGATKLNTDLADAGFTMVPFGQGYASMSAPTKELLNMVMSKQIRHGGNPVLRWMADSMDVKQDPTGNIKPVKPDRGKSGKRIDGIVALIMAIDRLIRNENVRSAWAKGEVYI